MESLDLKGFEPMTVTVSLSDQERIELELAHLKALLDALLYEKINLEQMIEYVRHEIRKHYAEAEYGNTSIQNH